MGLPAPVAEMMFFENSYLPIGGDVGFIGRQTTYLTERTLEHLAKKYSAKPGANFSIEIEDATVQAKEGFSLNGNVLRLITDRCLMKFIGANTFSAVDVSDYEGADVICDLSLPIADDLHERFDFIFNGSCLDNIFNPATALCNLSSMLRPGGRLIMIEHGSFFNGPYTIFSPGWFFDFFAENAYRDVKVYLGLFTDSTNLHVGPWPLYVMNWAAHPSGNAPKIPPDTELMYLIVAEKAVDSTNSKLPIQHYYRNPSDHERFFRPRAERILSSARPIYSQRNFEAAELRQALIRLPDIGSELPF